MFDFLKNIGPTEVVLIAVIFFLVFGSKALVNVSRKLGSSVKELKKVKEDIKTIKEEVA